MLTLVAPCELFKDGLARAALQPYPILRSWKKAISVSNPKDLHDIEQTGFHPLVTAH